MKKNIFRSLIIAWVFVIHSLLQAQDNQKLAKDTISVGEIVVKFEQPQIVVQEGSGGTTELGEYTITCTKMYSIINFENHFFINEEYIGLYKKGDTINYKDWLSRKDRIMIPSTLKERIDKLEALRQEEMLGIKYIFRSIGGVAFSPGDEKNYEAVLGSIYFEVVNGELIFRGKNYGKLIKGMTIRWENKMIISVK